MDGITNIDANAKEPLSEYRPHQNANQADDQLDRGAPWIAIL